MRQQHEVEANAHTIVGVNDFTEGNEEVEIETLRIGPEVEERQKARMAELRESRDDEAVERALAALTRAAADGSNLVPPILDCARVYGTLFEIRHAMEKVFGAYKEPVFF
jgi:methylmalonyl-CoA mutase N-terminal domain/subunit